MPDSLEYLGVSAFADCNLLQEVKFGHHLKNIPAYCFRFTDISYIKLEDGIESIGDSAFEYLKKLRKIDFCPSLKKIGDNTFSNNSRTLIELNFNDGLIEIGNNTFSNGWVENLYLPDSLKYIGEDFPMEKLKEVSCANIEVLDLFIKSQLVKYFDTEKYKKKNLSPFSFFLNIKTLFETSNGRYGEYYIICGNGYIIIESYINNKDKPRKIKETHLYDRIEYNAWSNALKQKEARIKKLNMQKKYLQSITQGIEKFLINFGKSFCEPTSLDMQETIQTDTIKMTNDEMKTLTDELFDSSKQVENMSELLAKEESSLPSTSANEMIVGVPFDESYEYIDNNDRMWRNGDMLTLNKQQQIEQNGVSLIKNNIPK